MQRIYHEAIAGQDTDPLAVTGVMLDAATWPLHAAKFTLRSQQLFTRNPRLGWYAQRGEHAVGEKDQTTAGAEQPGSLGNPEFWITPKACSVLTDNQVEGFTC